MYNTSSNRRVVFQPGVTIAALQGAFVSGADCLVSCYGLENVTFSGAGTTFLMHKAQYANHHLYNHSESRHGMQLLGCRNISIIGLNISSTGGDGIYVAGWGHHVVEPHGSRVFVSQRNHSAGIAVRDVHCHDNYRQGMSIISVVGMDVSNSTFSGTNGTAPQFGIDLEPNRVEDALQDINISGCSFIGNIGGGIMLGLHKLSNYGIPPLHDTSISISDCAIDGTGTVTQKNGHHLSRGPGPVSQLGILVSGGSYVPNAAGQISNVRVQNTSLQGLLIQGKAVEGELSLVFRNVSLVNTSHYDPLIHNRASKSAPPIMLTREKGMNNGGDLRFVNCTVTDDWNRSFFTTGTSGSHQRRGNLSDVRGTFSVVNPFGCHVALGPALADVDVKVMGCMKRRGAASAAAGV